MLPAVLRDNTILSICTQVPHCDTPKHTSCKVILDVYIPQARQILLGKNVEYRVNHVDGPQGKRVMYAQRHTISLLQFVQRVMDGDLPAVRMLLADDQASRATVKPLGKLILAELRSHVGSLVSKSMPKLFAQVDTAVTPFLLPMAQQEAVHLFQTWLAAQPQGMRLEELLGIGLQSWLKAQRHPWLVLYPKDVTGRHQPVVAVGKIRYPLMRQVGQVLADLTSQVVQLGHQSAAAVARAGQRPEDASRALGCVEEAIALLTTQCLAPSQTHQAYVQGIKRGEISPLGIGRVITERRAFLENLRLNGNLPDEPDTTWAEDLVARVYQEQVHYAATPYLPADCALKTPHTTMAMAQRGPGPRAAVPQMNDNADVLLHLPNI